MKEINHQIIIDLDNTLWDFASVFYDRLKKLVPNIPPIEEWHWEFYKDYISEEDLYRLVDEIHNEQELYEPFPSAKWFLESLENEGYKVIVASHRREDSRKSTKEFLKKHNLSYKELHLSDDKTVLFDSSIAIVDDAPHILDKAKQKGLISTGLYYPWNKNSDHSLFHSLEEVFGYLIDNLDGK